MHDINPNSTVSQGHKIIAVVINKIGRDDMYRRSRFR